MTNIIDTGKPAKRTRRMARDPKPAAEGQADIAQSAAKSARPASKSSQVLQMLHRPEGAAITVSGPLNKTTHPARAAASRVASTLE